MATCKKRVGKGALTWPCMVEIPDGVMVHVGPCAARENQSSIIVRERWMESWRQAQVDAQRSGRKVVNPEAADFFTETKSPPPVDPLSAYQSEPKTTAQLHTEPGSALPHPKAVTETEPRVWPNHDAFERPTYAEIYAGTDTTRPIMPFVIGEGPHPAPLVIDDGKDPNRLSRSSDTQPTPTPNDGSFSSHQQVIADTQARMEHGTRKYGTPLGPLNGRDSYQDAYEEALDLVAYMATCAKESRLVREELAKILFAFGSQGSEALAEGIGRFTSLCKRLGIEAQG